MKKLASRRPIEVIYLSLDSIGIGQENVRKTFNRAALDELRERIRAQGLLNPIGVAEHADHPGRYFLTDGFRRFRCLQELRSEGFTGIDYTQIPCAVRQPLRGRTKAARGAELAFVNIAENTHERVHVYELAEQFRRIKIEYGFSDQEIADHGGYDRSYVSRCLRALDNMIPAVKTYMRRGHYRRDRRFSSSLFLELCNLPKKKQAERFKELRSWDKTAKPRKPRRKPEATIRARAEVLLLQAKEKEAPPELIQLLAYLLGQTEAPPSPLQAPPNKLKPGF